MKGNWLVAPKLLVEFGDWTIVIRDQSQEGGGPFTLCTAEWLNPSHFAMEVSRRRSLLSKIGNLAQGLHPVSSSDAQLDDDFSIATNGPAQMSVLLSDREWRQQLHSIDDSLSVKLHPKQSSFRLTRGNVGTGVSDLQLTSSHVVNDGQKLLAMIAVTAATLERLEAVGITPPSVNQRPDYRRWLNARELERDHST